MDVEVISLEDAADMVITWQSNVEDGYSVHHHPEDNKVVIIPTVGSPCLITHGESSSA